MPSDEKIAICVEQHSRFAPTSVDEHFPEVLFQIFDVPSFEAVTTEALSGEKIAEFTQLLWPSSVNKHSPSFAKSQIFAVRSCDAVTTKLSSDEKIAEVTA